MTTRPRPLPHRLEKKLSPHNQTVLEAARQGKRDAETMAGWTFRFGMHGPAGRRCIQVRPYGVDTWFWVAWCSSEETQLPQVSSDTTATTFDRL